MDEYLLDQVYLRVSQLNVCAFCTDLHTRMQTKAGMRPETLTLVQIWSHPGHFFRKQNKSSWSGPNDLSMYGCEE